MRHAAQRRRSVWMPIVIGLVCSAMSLVLTTEVMQPLVLIAWLDDRPIPLSLWVVTDYIATVALEAAHRIAPHTWLRSPEFAFGQVLADVHAGLDGSDLRQRYKFILNVIGATSIIAFTVSFLTTWWLSPPVDRRTHVSGRRLIVVGTQIRRFFRRAERQAIKATGRGLCLCRGMWISAQRETRHFLLAGATGSGKTVLIKFLLWQIFRRGDRVILIDSKADFTAEVPDPFILLAPHDERSAIWDVAADVRSELDARELAASFIPASQDPLWSAGAREVLTGLIVALQLSDGTSWSWNDLQQTIFSPTPKLRLLLNYHYPEAAEYLELDAEGRPTKIAMSFVIVLRASLAGIVIPLAKAWPSSKDRRRFSVRAFLADGQTADRTLVLQRAANFPELSTAWMQALVTCAVNHVVSPALREDNKRRIWFCADEFPQLGKMEQIQQVLEVGRSRGICAILGIQDPHQLQHIYGADASKTWMSSIGTKIICRMEASASADLMRNEIIGKRNVAWTSKSKSTASWTWDGSGGGTTHSWQAQNEEVDVISSAFLETELGWFNAWPSPTIRALIVGVGRGDAQAVLRAEWPIEAWPTLRAPTMPADWTR